MPGPRARPFPLPAASLLQPFGIQGGGWEGKRLCCSQGSEKILKFVFFEDKGKEDIGGKWKPSRECPEVLRVFWAITPSRLSCDSTNATLCVSLLFQTNKSKNMLVHGDSHPQTQETQGLEHLAAQGTQPSPTPQLPGPHWSLGFSLAPFSFWGTGWHLPPAVTTIHNTPVSVETISWLGHTKAALFGNKLLERSREQPQTAASQENIEHSLSLVFLSATSRKKGAFWGNHLRLGWDRLTHQTDKYSSVWSVTGAEWSLEWFLNCEL